MIVNFLSVAEKKILSACESFVSRKNWILLLSLVLPIVVMLFSFPPYERLSSEYVKYWQALLIHVAHPFQNFNYPPASHQAKLTFRLTVPLIAYVLHLGMVGILIVQAVFGGLLFYFSAKLFNKITQDKVVSLLLTLSVAFIWAGRTSFVELRGIFDGVALFFLVFSMCYKNPLLIFLSVFLAAWTDERGLIASGLVFLFWVYSEDKKGRKLVNSYTLAVVLAWIAYFIGRYLLVVKLHFVMATGGVGLKLLFQQISNMPLGVWSALEGNWLMIAVALIGLVKMKKHFFAFSYTAMMLIVVVVSMSVIDITRSMAYMLPALFIAVSVVRDMENTVIMRRIILLAAIVCLLYPAYYTGGQFMTTWNYPLPLRLIQLHHF